MILENIDEFGPITVWQSQLKRFENYEGNSSLGRERVVNQIHDFN